MTGFNLYQATGLTSQELAEVFQRNPRAYMAVRGAVAEKHLEKILSGLAQEARIDFYRAASGDMEKDFYVQVGVNSFTLECKNIEVIKINQNKAAQLSYLEYLIEQGYLSVNFIDSLLGDLNLPGESIQRLTPSQLKDFIKKLPQEYKESGLVRYQYSASKIPHPQLGSLPDYEFVDQFNDFPMTIDFQKTRNSTDKDGDTRRQRYYRTGEIDIVGACLFSRTMEWSFLYAKAENFEKHSKYPERYSNGLTLKPGVWTSNLLNLIC